MSTQEQVNSVCCEERVRENEKMIQAQRKRGLLVEAGALT